MDALQYTKDELRKQWALLQTHASQYPSEDSGFCKECMDKHLLLIEGLSEEGTSMTESDKEKQMFQDMAEEARAMRKAIGNPDSYCPTCGESNSNPKKHKIECHHGKCECVIRGESKEFFDKESFRRMKDYPKKGYDTVIGCPEGQFVSGKCQVGTAMHKIICPIGVCK